MGNDINIDKASSPDGRYKIVQIYESSSDHFYGSTDLQFDLIDIKSGKTIHTFTGEWSQPETIQTIEFSDNSKEAIAKNKKGKIIEKFQLPQQNKKTQHPKAPTCPSKLIERSRKAPNPLPPWPKIKK